MEIRRSSFSGIPPFVKDVLLSWKIYGICKLYEKNISIKFFNFKKLAPLVFENLSYYVTINKNIYLALRWGFLSQIGFPINTRIIWNISGNLCPYCSNNPGLNLDRNTRIIKKISGSLYFSQKYLKTFFLTLLPNLTSM